MPTEPAKVVVAKELWERQWEKCRASMKVWISRSSMSEFHAEEMMRQFERLKGNLEAEKPKYDYYQ